MEAVAESGGQRLMEIDRRGTSSTVSEAGTEGLDEERGSVERHIALVEKKTLAIVGPGVIGAGLRSHAPMLP